MVPGMSRPANRYDDTSCESFMKIVKQAEIYPNGDADLEHMRIYIEAFIEEYYNRQRLHSTWGCRPPEEFEQRSDRGHSTGSVAATVHSMVNDGNYEATLFPA
jgi:putative transposase